MKKLAILVAAGALLSMPVLGQDIAAGKAKYNASCLSCHGPDGKSTIPINPKLNGQFASYLIAQTNDIKDRKRTNGLSATMIPFVSSLTQDDIKNISAYLESVE